MPHHSGQGRNTQPIILEKHTRGDFRLTWTILLVGKAKILAQGQIPAQFKEISSTVNAGGDDSDVVQAHSLTCTNVGLGATTNLYITEADTLAHSPKPGRNSNMRIALAIIASATLVLASKSSTTTSRTKSSAISSPSKSAANRFINSTIVSVQPQCQGTATFTHATPGTTVFVTVTEGFAVTVAQNDSLTDAATLFTPPAACSTTIISSIGSSTVTPSTITSIFPVSTSTIIGSTIVSGGGGHPHPGPLITSDTPTQPVYSIYTSYSVVYNTVVSFSLPPAYAVSQDVTTVTITKKTPVPTTYSPSQPVAQFPDNPTQAISFNQGTTADPTTKEAASNIAPTNSVSNIPQPSASFPQSNRVAPTVRPAPQTSANVPGPSNPIHGGGGSTNQPQIKPTQTAPPIITIPVTTSVGAVLPTSKTINGVSISIGISASAIQIGTTQVILPSGTSSATVVANGQTFTVLSNTIIAPSTTFALAQPATTIFSAVQVYTLSSSTVSANGVVATIGATAAVVSGTTYRIPAGTSSTTIVVSGQTLTLESAGLVVSSTTFAPALTTVPAYMVTAIGGLTISRDASEAIISGTTYLIGSAAGGTGSTAVIDGTTLTFGSNGVVLSSTTLAPTHVSVTGTVEAGETGSASTGKSGAGTNGGVQATGSAGGGSASANSATRGNVGFGICLLGGLCMVQLVFLLM